MLIQYEGSLRSTEGQNLVFSWKIAVLETLRMARMF